MWHTSHDNKTCNTLQQQAHHIQRVSYGKLYTIFLQTVERNLKWKFSHFADVAFCTLGRRSPQSTPLGRKQIVLNLLFHSLKYFVYFLKAKTGNQNGGWFHWEGWQTTLKAISYASVGIRNCFYSIFCLIKCKCFYIGTEIK